MGQSDPNATGSLPAISSSLQVFTGRTDLQRLLKLYSDDSHASFDKLTIDELKVYATLVSRTAMEPTSPSSKGLPPVLIGHYEILSEIGRGGFAGVYKALDTKLGRLVALKVLDPILARDPATVQRFLNSMKAWANLDHPNIVKIYEFGEYEGKASIILQLIDGLSLHHVLRQLGRLPWQLALSVAKQTASALDYVHDKGILHLDIKPGNILIDSKQRVFLTDFDSAQMVAASAFISSGVVVGTFSYMAPEQVAGEPLSSASDVYALATVFYEMITGTPLVSGEVAQILAVKGARISKYTDILAQRRALRY